MANAADSAMSQTQSTEDGSSAKDTNLIEEAGNMPRELSEANSRDVEARRWMPNLIRRQIEQAPRMPGVPVRDYFEMFVIFKESTGAGTVVEYQFVLDTVFATMEIQFYRRMKPLVIERSARVHAQRKPNLPTDIIDEAEIFLNSIGSLSQIDRLIDAATRRRSIALRDIERHQSKFAERLRVVSRDVIDGKVTPKDWRAADDLAS